MPHPYLIGIEIMKLPTWLLALLILFLTNSANRDIASGQEQLEITGRTMGPIPFKVLIPRSPERVEPIRFRDEVYAALERINGLMSTYIEESDVSRFNRLNSSEPLQVNKETAVVVSRALEISNKTNGAFDITVGPAVNRWRFGPDKSKLTIPTSTEIDELRSIVGYENIVVDLNQSTIKKTNAKTQIDLSAIAKGYAVDQVAVSLKELGCQHFMVEVGGEVYTFGERAAGGAWRIGVENPTDSQIQQPIGEVAELSGKAMATSGDYRNFKVIEGKRFSHTIDPTTCQPVSNRLASACVVANDCMTADALATAMMVLGPKEGQAVCERLGIDYIFKVRDKPGDLDNRFTVKISNGFPIFGKESKTEKSVMSEIVPIMIGSIIVFGLVIVGMAVGSIFANKPVRGSCGGLANMTNEDGEEVCGVCSKPTSDCVEKDPTTV